MTFLTDFGRLWEIAFHLMLIKPRQSLDKICTQRKVLPTIGHSLKVAGCCP